MAYLDRADIILRVKDRLNRPTTDSAFTIAATDDVWLRFMTEAQDDVTKMIATYIPDAMISVPTALVTADSGITYTFGTDTDSANYFPLGHFSVYASRSDIPDFPLEPGIDFIIEGTRLRMVNNVARTFGDGGPWAQTVNASNVITSSTQPSIPVICRMTMVEITAEKGARRLGLDSQEFKDAAGDAWAKVLTAVRSQAQGKYGAPSRYRPQWQYWGRR